MAVPRIGQFTQDISTNSGGWFAGDGFTGTLNFYYDPTLSITTINSTNQKNEIKAALDGGYSGPSVTSPSTITWSSNANKVNANFTVYNDNALYASPSPDQADSNGNPIISYCCPFSIRNASGYSATGVFNKPQILGLAGSDPSKLYYGTLYTLGGRHMQSLSVKQTSLWLLKWDGSSAVSTSNLYQLNLTQPGGYGNGIGTSPTEKAKNVLFFEVPSTVPADTYYLVVFTNENRYGLAISPTASFTVVGTQDPWLANPTVKTDLMSTASGTDITQSLTNLLFNAAFGASKPTESAPWKIMLPPGVFYVSHMLPWPDHTGLVGSGTHMTRLLPNPALNGLANSAGSFYYDLSSYSTANSNCYTGTVNGVTKLLGIFSGDQRVDNARGSVIRIRGANTQFRDMTFETSPTNWNITVRSLFSTSGNINRVHFERVRFYSTLATQTDYGNNSGGFPYQAFYKFTGQCLYWKFRDCLYECDQVLYGTNGITNGFANNGAYDNLSIEFGHFHPPHNKTSAANFGVFGRNCVAYGLEITNSRRGFIFANGDGLMDSTIMCCGYDSMLSEFGAPECNLMETRTGTIANVASATSNSFTVSGDSQNRTRWTAYIASGTGRYQFRVIASSSSGTHTLETPWTITPDNTSVVITVQAPTNVGFVFNRFTSVLGGINFYGNSFGCFATKNWFRNSHEGLMFNTAMDLNNSMASVAVWNNSRKNTFENSSAHQMVAPRTTTDLATYTFPQIAFTSINGCIYYGDCINQMWAAQGVESTYLASDETMTVPTDYSSVKLIDFVSCNAEFYYSDHSRYNHVPIATTYLLRAPWHKSIGGVGTFLHSGVAIDDRAVSNVTPLLSTTTYSPALTTGEYSLTTLTGNDIVNVSANVSTLLTRLGTPSTTVAAAVDAVNTKTAQITITGGGDVRAALSSVGLDSIAVDRTPSWPPTNMRQLLNWLLVRFFNRVSKASGTLTIYGSNNMTPISAQIYSEGVATPQEEVQQPS